MKMTIRDRYASDQVFRQLVDMMLHTIIQGQFTPTEIREAAMLAQIRYEELHPTRPTTFGIDEVRRGSV